MSSIVLVFISIGAYYFLTRAPQAPIGQDSASTYFEIPELGLKLAMPEGKNDLVYTIKQFDNDQSIAAYLSSRSLIAAEQEAGETRGYCSAEYGPIGVATLVDGKTSYVGPQATCSDDPVIQELQSSYIALLRDRIPGASPQVSDTQHNERYPDTVREVRPLQQLRSWTHPNGTVVRLYAKDRFVESNEYGIETAEQKILKAYTPDGKELVLLNNEPWNVYLSTDLVNEVRFSPSGTYVVVTGLGYEASFAATYNLKTGDEEFTKAYVYDYAIPYWNSDESKLALIRPSHSIDGTVAAVFHSPTGNPADLRLIKDFRAEKPAVTDPYLDSTSRLGDILTLTFWLDRKMWAGGPYDIDQIYTFDLDSGTLILKETLQR